MPILGKRNQPLATTLFRAWKAFLCRATHRILSGNRGIQAKTASKLEKGRSSHDLSRFDLDPSRFNRDPSRFDRDLSRSDLDQSRFDRDQSRFDRDLSRLSRHFSGSEPVAIEPKRAFLGFSLAGTLFFAAFLAVLAPFTRVLAQTPAPQYKIEAVYLFNFLNYVQWPTNAFATDQSPYVIGILGRDPFGATLNEVVGGETVRGRKIEVRRFKSVSEIKTCHLLFISPSESSRTKSIVTALKGKAILTVSDGEDFVRQGGMVRFILENNKIRFRINLSAAQEAHLTISAKLLQLSEVIRDEHPSR